MSRNAHHVVSNSKGGWSVRKEGATRASKSFDTKTDAIAWGRKESKCSGTELVIHGKDGTIQRKDSHGKYRNPPRDRDTH